MQETQGNLRDFLTVLFKHKSKIIVIFLAVVITVTAGTFLLSPVYEAKSSLLVKIGRENIYRPEVGSSNQVISINGQEEVVNSEINILTSQDLIEKVITSLKVENLYPDLTKSPPAKMTPMDAAVIAFGKSLTAEAVKKSNVIEVTFRHKDPGIAARAVNLLVEFYTVKHLQVYSGTESSFLDSQLAVYDQKLKESATNLEAFKQKNQVYSLDEQRSLLLKQRTDLDTALKNSINTIDELQKRLSSLKGLKQTVAADSSLYTTSELDRIIVEARSRLLTLQLEEQDLLKKYTEDNRLVLNVRNEIRMVKEFLADQENTIGGKVKTGNLVYQDVQKELVTTEADLSAQQAKADTLKRQVAQLDSELQNLDLRDKELQGLKRDYAITEKNYQTYTEKTEEARISDDMNRSKLANVSVIQAAAVPAKPVKPNKRLNIALGIILGAVSALGFAFFSEYTSQVFTTPESAEKRLGLPLLATIAQKKGSSPD
jgi:uncharacterized protein involved in exopolysaccharide biosynthesis